MRGAGQEINPSGWPRYAVWSGLAAFGLVYLAALQWHPHGAIASLLSDDAFYYFKIARNIVEGRGSTFDGIVPTNGYHPLWMLCVVGIYSLGSASPEGPVLWVMALNAVMAVATLFWVFRLVERSIAPGFGLLALAAFALPNLLNAMTNGMETGILLLSLVALQEACYRFEIHRSSAPPWQSLLYGLLLGIVFVSRLDTAFLFIAGVGLSALAGLLGGSGFRRVVGRAVLQGVGFAALALPFFAWNWFSFGKLMPISGAVKSSFPLVRQSFALQGDMAFGLALLLVTTVLVAIASLGEYRERRSVPGLLQSPLLALWLAGLSHFLYVFLFTTWGTYWWHFVLTSFAFALALPAAARTALAERPRWKRAVAGALAAAMFATGAVVKVADLENKGRRHGAWWEAANWARSNTDENARIALVDAGLFGYFSERAVINLDGKVNGYEYRDYVERGDIEDYLRRVHVDYVANIACRYREGKCGIGIPRANGERVLLFMDARWEVYRSGPLPRRILTLRGADGSRFMIFRYPASTSP